MIKILFSLKLIEVEFKNENLRLLVLMKLNFQCIAFAVDLKYNEIRFFKIEFAA